LGNWLIVSFFALKRSFYSDVHFLDRFLMELWLLLAFF
jgi:hypothetical protein